jgi:LCP family protein required for cell wall assembly
VKAPSGERPPRVGLKQLGKAGIAGFLVVAVTGAALATAVIREVGSLKDTFLGTEQGRQQFDIPEITRAQAGGPRTILLLGSDLRYEDKKLGIKPRSDTMLLVRADPDADAIGVMSIPRDLEVRIPGLGRSKINSAYEEGGPRLAVRTVKQLFEDATGEEFPINNAMVVNFGSFRRAVDYIGGVYVDVDRDYFNDNSGPGGYAKIDIDPGYQKLGGPDALDYVRYRHTDNDLVRAARQQDFLRQARNMAGVRKLISLGDRRRLVRAFGRYFQVDKTFRSTREIFSMLRLGFYMIQERPRVNEVRFRAREADNPAVNTNLYASKRDLRTMVGEFMNAEGSSTPRTESEPTVEDRQFQRARQNRNRRAPIAGLEDARREGVDQAVLADPELDFPFYFPALRYRGSVYAGKPRVYRLRDETGKRHDAYRIVVSKGIQGEYYGVQGMTWKRPPILDDPDETRRIAGRQFQLFYDGDRLRLVAWRTKRAVYWVSNTLTQSLGSRQMLGIAASLRHLKQ